MAGELRRLGEEVVDVGVVFYWDDGDDDDGDGGERGQAWALGPVFEVKRVLGGGGRWRKVTYAVGKEEGSVVPGWVGRRREVSVEEPVVLEYTPAELPTDETGPEVKAEEEKEESRHSIVAGTYPCKYIYIYIILTNRYGIVGGTFDHLHAGHKLLLTTTAFLLDPPACPDSPPRRLIVGLTGPQLLQTKKHAEYLQPWHSRAADTANFLISILTFSPCPVDTPDGPQETVSSPATPISPQAHVFDISDPAGGSITVEIEEINDPFGPTITNQDITALVVSDETAKGGLMVNDRRREKGWKELEVYVVEVVMEGEGEGKMSSTERRRRRRKSAGTQSVGGGIVQGHD